MPVLAVVGVARDTGSHQQPLFHGEPGLMAGIFDESEVSFATAHLPSVTMAIAIATPADVPTATEHCRNAPGGQKLLSETHGLQHLHRL